ncbi:solute carrier family 22 member 8-like [Mizuhopecten yessoensis]|uniref:solute carrier family 22 member 8-like n=1 Tax=Mizuhopecten yessoensis TaxID=6573 RepID=UPI000B45EF77|nr:solute carrier family 22 member 8-like [Mizuhopecten yessoensis]
MTDQHFLDNIWRTLGTWGRYQRIQMALHMATYGSEAFQLMIIVFIGYRPSYQCADLGNTTSMYDTLSNASLTPLYQACHVDILINGTNTTLMKLSPCPAGYTYDLEKDRTFVTEWNLVCDGAERAEISQMLLMIGQMVGAALLPQLSDRFGRKLVLVTSHIVLFAAGVTASLAPTFIVFAIMRFICGVSHQGVSMTRTVMTIELLPAESRYMTEVLGVTFWTCGIIVIAPVAYLLRNLSWRNTYLIMTMYSAYSLVGYWCVYNTYCLDYNAMVTNSNVTK